VVKHLSALADAGLVTSERAGREVRFQVSSDGISGAVSWLVTVGDRWDRRLDALHRHLGDRSAG
jgi:DNA-binding transcriptional ArsR family regulator